MMRHDEAYMMSQSSLKAYFPQIAYCLLVEIGRLQFPLATLSVRSVRIFFLFSFSKFAELP